MSQQTVAIEQRDQVLVVTLNRPSALNALSTQMGRELYDLWTRLTAEPGDTRCVVLTGAGDRAFCAGADLKERDGMSQADWQAQHELFERGFMALMELPLPVIAALNGHAFGGGLEIGVVLRFHLRGERRALRAAGSTPGHHAGRRRHPEPRARGRRAPREGAHPVGAPVQRRGRRGVGPVQRRLRFEGTA